MKNTVVTTTLITCLLGLSCSAFAKNGDPVPGTWLMVRSGAANTDGNYDGEDKDINGKLEQVSALCKDVEETSVEVAKLVKSDKTRNWGVGPTWWVSKASTATGQGGKVVIDAQTNNPNHCLISGLKIGNMKGIWHQSP